MQDEDDNEEAPSVALARLPPQTEALQRATTRLTTARWGRALVVAGALLSMTVGPWWIGAMIAAFAAGAGQGVIQGLRRTQQQAHAQLRRDYELVSRYEDHGRRALPEASSSSAKAQQLDAARHALGAARRRS